MSNRPAPAPALRLESLEERVDVLFRELELAVQWQRPSILFAIYRSEYVRTDAALRLAHRLEATGQQVLSLTLADLSRNGLSSLPDPQRTIVFIQNAPEAEDDPGYLALDRQCDGLLDREVRLVLWLTEGEAINLARYAPDFWALRHRVVEFLDPPSPSQILCCALESAWKNGSEPFASVSPAEPLALGDSLFANLAPQPGDGANAHLLLTLAILHWRKGDVVQAAHLLETALQSARLAQDTVLEACCHQAMALLRTARGHLDEAIESCKQALQLLPEQASLWNNLGALYARIGFYPDALHAFRQASVRDPQDVLNWNDLGNAALQAGLFEEALEAYRKATTLSPAFAAAWLGMSHALARLGRLGEASQVCQRALALDERQPEPWLTLGDLLVRRQSHAEALRAYQRALELDSQNAPAWNEVGVLHFRRGEFALAEEAFRQAIALQPQCGWFYANLALTCSQAERDEEAIPLYRQAIALLEEDTARALLFSRLGDVCQRLGDEPTARTAYLHAREHGADLDWFGHDLRAAPHSLLHPDEDDVPLSLPSAVTTMPEKPLSAAAPLPLPARDLAVEAGREAVDLACGASLAGEGDWSAEASLEMACGASLAGEDDWSAETPPEMACGASLAGEGDWSAEASLEMACGASLAGEGDWSAETPPEMACGAWAVAEATASLAGQSAAVDEKGEPSPSATPEMSAAEWNACGNACLAAGHYEEAIAAYSRALQLTPGFFWPYVHNLALAYQQRASHADKAMPPAEASLPDHASVRQTVPEQIPSPQPSVEASPTEEPLRLHPSAENLRLPEEARQEDPATARQSAPAASSLLSATLDAASVEKTADAAQSSALALEVDFTPSSAQEWNAVGNALLKVGAYERAMAAYARAIALAPQDGWPYSNLALAYYYARRYAEAIPLYQKSLELLKSNREKAIVWNRLGDVYRRLHDDERARAAYQRAAELDNRAGPLLQRARLILLGNRRN